MLKKLKLICGIVPILVCITLIIFYILSGKNLSADNIINFIQTDNLIIAAIILFLMFAVKSLSVCFPIMVLYIASGCIFPPVTAIIINIIGTAICFSLPYFIGRFSGSEIVKKIEKKYPRISAYLEKQKNNEFFISFLFRSIRCMPLDIISMYFGSLKFSYLPYLIASLLGEIPGLIFETLIGTSIDEPDSPMFWLSIGMTVFLTVASVVCYYIYLKKSKKNRN